MDARWTFAILIVMLLAGVSSLTFSVIFSEAETLTVASTTSPIDTGLLTRLNEAFEAKYGVRVKSLALGSGQALEYGKRGDADLVIVHARELEERFVAEGHGIGRVGIMFNEFFILGPPSDPAAVAKAESAVGAFRAIYVAGERGEAIFVSRGDRSGTHVRELMLWEAAGLQPEGEWYLEAGRGMAATLRVASEKGAYTLSDSATYTTYAERLGLKVLFQGDPALINPYAAILVNPERHPDVNFNLAFLYVKFLVSEEGQSIIRDFAYKDEAIFHPLAQKVSLAERLGFPGQAEALKYYGRAMERSPASEIP